MPRSDTSVKYNPYILRRLNLLHFDAKSSFIEPYVCIFYKIFHKLRARYERVFFLKKMAYFRRTVSCEPSGCIEFILV